MDMLHTVIFIGRSGSGKGTQAGLLRERINNYDMEKRQILYVETGERFRQFIRQDNISAKHAKEINDVGGLQPVFLAAWMWGNVLIEELGENMHLMFDGAPRAFTEAEVLTTALEFYKRERATVVYINVGKKWSEDKLLARGRTDDMSIQKIDTRLAWFDANVVPALEYFKRTPYYRVIEINGEQTVEKVFDDLIKAYENK